MITIDQQEAIVKAVEKRVKKLQPILVNKYFNAVTPWLVRNVLECAEQLKAMEGKACPLYTDYRKSCKALQERKAELAATDSNVILRSSL